MKTREADGEGGLGPTLHVLDDRQDVPLGVLEPRGLRPARGDDVAVLRGARHVVVLELHALRLQLGDLALDVVDLRRMRPAPTRSRPPTTFRRCSTCGWSTTAMRLTAFTTAR